MALGIAEQLEAAFSFRPSIKIGLFSATKAEKEWGPRTNWPRGLLKIEKVLDLASYAATSVAESVVRMRTFDRDTPRLVLYASRKAKAIEVAEKDFNEFLDMELLSDQVVNQMMLTYYETNQPQKAGDIVSDYREYIAKSNDRFIILNAALVKYAADDIETALMYAVRGLSLGELESLLDNPIYPIILARMMISATASGGSKVEPTLMTNVLKVALKLPHEQLGARDRFSFQRALQKIDSPQTVH